jgi:hypothetical protein
MASIYRKTNKGVEEIATRAHRLSPRLRTALILVDGTRDEAQLRSLIAQGAAEALQELVSDGYIEVSPVLEEPRKPERAAAPAATPAAAQPAAAPAASDKAAFAKYRAEAVRAFNDLTGPAGEALAIKMERTGSREQLAPLLEIAHQIITNARGAQAANEFKARFASF